MSEHQANQLTIWAIAVMLPLVGIAKFWFAIVMKRNTHTRTKIGSWLLRLFCAMGMMCAAFGAVYFLALAGSYQWVPSALWVRWIMRSVVVASACWALICNFMLVKALLPVLGDIPDYAYRDRP